MTRKLTKVVRGALVDTIHTHGPITTELVDSAAKRVVGTVEALVYVEEGHARCRMALERSERRNARLRFGHERLRQMHERLKAEHDRCRFGAA